MALIATGYVKTVPVYNFKLVWVIQMKDLMNGGFIYNDEKSQWGSGSVIPG